MGVGVANLDVCDAAARDERDGGVAMIDCEHVVVGSRMRVGDRRRVWNPLR